jgi:MFS family permease
MVFELTNSAAWSAVIFGINRVPTIFLQPFAGALVENRNKKCIMVLADVIRGICVSLVAAMLVLNILNPWILLGFTLVISSAEAFRNPASTAILPKILDKKCYDFGISLNSTLSSVTELAGLALVGAIIAFFGTQTAILIDAVTFWGSALIILLIHTGEERSAFKKIKFTEYFNTLQEGFAYIKNRRIILNFVLLAMVANAILVPFNSLMAPLVKDVLKQGEYMLSAISVTITAGMGLGSALYPYAAMRIKTEKIVFISGITISIYYFMLAVSSYLSSYAFFVYIICMGSSFITGAILSLLISALNVQFLKQVETDYLARAGAILSAGCVGAIPAASFMVGILTKLIPLTNIFYVISGTGFIFFIFIYFKKVKFE